MTTKRITSEELAAVPGVRGEWIAILESHDRAYGKLSWYKISPGAHVSAPTKEEAIEKLLSKVASLRGEYFLKRMLRAKGVRVMTTFVPTHPAFAPDNAATKRAMEFKEGLK